MMKVPVAHVRKLASDVRASYWFIPAVLVVTAIVAEAGMSWVDRNAAEIPALLPEWMLDSQVAGARSVLTVVASSVIGVAGVMFSVTIVAVTFASGNYGPRLIANFMRDRGNQWSLGILISTFVYTILVLRQVRGEGANGEAVFVPQYSLWVTILLALLSVATMIYYVHHVPETINVSRITAALGRRLREAVSCDVPAGMDSFGDRTPVRRPGWQGMTLDRTGYVQAVDIDGLEEACRRFDAEIEILAVPGTFVASSEHAVGFRMRGAAPDGFIDAVRAAFAMGPTRTELQNPEFIAQQLVEMIARALSPGVNDPYTAINCLNWLHAALLRMLETDSVEAARGTRVSYPCLTFPKLMAASYGDCLPYVKSDPLACRHMDQLLARLEHRATGEDMREVALMRQTLAAD